MCADRYLHSRRGALAVLRCSGQEKIDLFKNTTFVYRTKVVFLLVETIRVELMTSCMSSMRSNQLSYASVTTMYIISHSK